MIEMALGRHFVSVSALEESWPKLNRLSAMGYSQVLIERSLQSGLYRSFGREMPSFVMQSRADV